MLALLETSFGSSDELADPEKYSGDSSRDPAIKSSGLARTQPTSSSTDSPASSLRLESYQNAIEQNHWPDNLRINAGRGGQARLRLPYVASESAEGQDSVRVNPHPARAGRPASDLATKQSPSSCIRNQTSHRDGCDTAAAQSAIDTTQTDPPRRGDSNLAHKRDCCAYYSGQANLSVSGSDRIRSRLLEVCLHYSVKRVGKLNEEDLSSEEVVDDPVEQGALASKHSAAELQTLCLKDKPSSIAVQKHLSKLSQANLDRVARHLCTELDRLLTDRFGSYVIQHLVEFHQPTLKSVAATISNNFIKYSTNEFSSRIMQRMFQLDRDFSVRCFELMKKYFKQLINNFSGSILLTKLVACVIGDAYYAFVIKILEQNKEYLRKAYFNRMLSTLVS